MMRDGVLHHRHSEEGMGEMSILKKKVASRRGASITFALLLFLVCAVISAVVVVSATATAGRMSKMAEMDQRYYAVTSAARLLRDAIEGATVTVTTIAKTDTTKTETTDTETGMVTVNEAKVKQPNKYSFAQGAVSSTITDPNESDLPLLIEAACVQTGVRALPETGWPRPLVLTATDGSLDTSALTVDVNETLRADGSMVFDVSNSNGTAAEKYQLRLTFSAQDCESSSQTSLGEPTTTTDGNTVTSTTTQSVITTQTLKWKMTGIQLRKATTGGA